MIPWDKIAANYASGTRRALEHLMPSPLEDGSGQLMLWH